MNTIELPFDQYQRYSTLKKIVSQYKKEMNINRPLKVLDVGGLGINSQGEAWLPLKEFLEGEDITVLDIIDVELDGYIKGTGIELEFGDNSFDIVTSNDALEHILQNERKKFINELLRVSRELIVLTYPQKTYQNELAEKILYEYILKETKGENRMLEEHLRNGLPSKEEVIHYLDGKYEYEYFGSGKTSLWLLMMFLKYYVSTLEDSEELIKSIDRYFNEIVSFKDYSMEECYRVVFMISKNKVVDKNCLLSITDYIFNENKRGFATQITHVPTLFAELIRMKKENENKIKLDQYQYEWHQVTPKLTKDFSIKQSFICHSYNLYAIEVLVATYNEILSGYIEFILYQGSERIYTSKINIQQFKDNQWYEVKIPQIVESKDKEFTIEFRSITDLDKGFSIYYNDRDKISNFSINKEQIVGKLNLKVKVRDNNLGENEFISRQKNLYYEQVNELLDTAQKDILRQLDEISLKNQELGIQINNKDEEIQIKEQNILKAKQEKNELEKEYQIELNKRNKDNVHLQEEKETLQNEIITFKNKVIELEDETTRLQNEIKTLQNTNKELEKELNKYKTHIKNIINSML